MSEARKLDSSPEPSREPELFGGAEPAHEPEIDLSPEAVPRTADAVESRPALRPPKRSRGTFNVLLILFLVGIVGFAAGVAVAAAVLMGMMDLQTGWVKDTLATIKDLAQHFTGH